MEKKEQILQNYFFLCSCAGDKRKSFSKSCQQSDYYSEQL